MTPLSRFLLGACAMITVLAASRLIAPFYGLGPFLEASAGATGLIALALGLLLGSRRRQGDTGSSGTALFVAAALTLVTPWSRTPALRLLERFGLPTATCVALVLLLGLPLVLIGYALAGSANSNADGESTGSALTGAAPALFGAALASAITP